MWKVSSSPADLSRAVADGAGEALAQVAGRASDVSNVGHGTTVATNALIQHCGAATGLITSDGFRDLLEIGLQRRPDLYEPSSSLLWSTDPFGDSAAARNWLFEHFPLPRAASDGIEKRESERMPTGRSSCRVAVHQCPRIAGRQPTAAGNSSLMTLRWRE